VNETSSDAISLRGAGIVQITQPKKGSRFTLDSLLLADFCRIKPRDRALEPGAGTGIISLLLAKKFPKARFVADEVEPHAYNLLCRNIELNGLSDRIVTVDRDIKHICRSLLPNAFDVIVANPPYVQFGTGRKSPSLKRQTARHDQSASIALWLNLQGLLKMKGRYFLVFPARRASELMSLLRARKLEPKRIRFVHPRLDKPASIFLMEAVKGGGAGIEILPPLIVHEQAGDYTDELKEIYGLQDLGRRKR
jgi:tRNA1Val (adenine37-N6)-methyltransferase